MNFFVNFSILKIESTIKSGNFRLDSVTFYKLIMEILYDMLKFYLENESEFEKWLEDARLNGIDLKRIDGEYPAHYPYLPSPAAYTSATI